jgi:hypothetical protein
LLRGRAADFSYEARTTMYWDLVQRLAVARA